MANRGQKPFTDAERKANYLAMYGEQAINLMRKRYQRGAKMAVVGQAVGVTREMAHKIVRAFGWSRRVTSARPARYSQPWSLADWTTLRRMMAAQESTQKIAEVMQRSYSTVVVAMQSVHAPGYHGNGWQAWTSREEKILITQYRARRTTKEIARMLERTPGQCQNRISLLQKKGVLEHKLKRWTPQEDRELLRLREQGKTYMHIAFALDRGLKTTKNRYFKLTHSLSMHQ